MQKQTKAIKTNQNQTEEHISKQKASESNQKQLQATAT